MTDINPIKSTIDLPVITKSEILTASMIGLFLFAIIVSWLFYKYGRKYFIKKKIEVVPEEVKTDYNLLLGNMMAEVKKKLDLGSYKEFHLKIAELLKFYFEKKYDCSALAMTSAELDKLDKLSPWQKRKIKEFFEKNDMAKFAGMGLEATVAKEVLGIVEELLKDRI